MESNALLKTLVLAFILTSAALAEDIPFQGNAYATTGSSKLDSKGFALSRADDVVSLFFHVDRAADLKLALKAAGESAIRASVAGQSFTASLRATDAGPLELGTALIATAGYVRVDFSGSAKTLLSALVVDPSSADVVVSQVKDNADNRFYWGRRGPSVHLRYEAPKDTALAWFYNEITVL